VPVAARVAEWANGPLAGTDAFVLGDQAVTFRELAARAAAVAAGLRGVERQSRNWQPGDARLLAIGTGNHPSFAELFVGGTAGDGACAVLDPLWGREQAREVLTRLRPDLLVVADRPDLRDLADELGIGVLTESTYEKWLASADPDRWLTAGADDSTFLVGFTSGSTGLPKAFHRSRRSWRVSLAAGRSVWAMDEHQHTFAPGPLAHGLCLYALAECLEAGATWHGLPAFDRAEVVRRLASVDIRRLVVVPTMLAALCEATGDTFPGVRAVVSGGAKLPPELVPSIRRVLPNAHVAEYYGASELGFVTAQTSGTESDDVGVAYPGVTIEVRDSAGSPVPEGEPGELWVRSPLRCDGYLWGEGGFRTDGEWATVGDVGRLSPDGRLHLVGRGGMVVTGGLNVYLSEVEAALTRLPQIDEAVVGSVPDDYLGRVLVAVISGDGAAGLSLERLRELCRPFLARYKVPRRCYTVSVWPRTASGKIARGEIEEWIAHDPSRLVPLPDRR
jgi:acyl-CoA synthetase (AMP-forming)/AMP-acid ligase II